MEKRYSLKHIAELSGVSLSSVSRALDPTRRHMVRPELREKIQNVVLKENFSINPSARRLRRSKTEVITVIVYLDSFKQKTFSVDFVSPSTGRDDIQCLSAAIKARYYDMKLEFILPEQQLPAHVFDHNRTDGVIFVSYFGTEYVRYLEECGLPNLYLSRYIDTSREDVNLVGLNREPGYRQAIEALLRAGHRRFAWFSPPMQTSLRVNINIVNELFREYGIFNERLFLPIFYSYYDIQAILKVLRDVDVIFCSNDVIADWVVRELERNGVLVPEEVSVIGYDNDQAYHGTNTCNVATIDAPKSLMAESAVDALLRSMESKKNEGRVHILLDTVFLPGSTARLMNSDFSERNPDIVHNAKRKNE